MQFEQELRRCIAEVEELAEKRRRMADFIVGVDPFLS